MTKTTERTQVEQLRAEARVHAAGGRLAVALELYCRATELAPSDPWIAHGAAEFARRLKRDDLALAYLRRAAAAFVAMGQTRYALPALRSCWLLSRARLPEGEPAFQEITEELAAVQRDLEFHTDASTTEALAADARRSHGLGARSEPPRAPLESLVRSLAAPAPSPSMTHPEKPSFIARVRRALCA